MSLFFVNAPEEDEDDVDALNMVGRNRRGDSSGNVSDGSVNAECGQYNLQSFWPTVATDMQRIKSMDVRYPVLPLARIKKIMKLDENVKMISSEAPILLAKAAEIFIMELTLRAWVHTDENKRRTLQRSDIAMAITRYDQFDFLIDIVPREESKCGHRSQDFKPSNSSDQVHYYFQLAQPGDLASNVASATQTVSSQPTVQVIQAPLSNTPQQLQAVTLSPSSAQISQEQSNGNSSGNNMTGNILTTNVVAAMPSEGGAQQIIQLNAAQQHQQNTNNSGSSGQLQFLQQVVSPNGEVQHIPIVVQVPVQQQQRRK